MHFALLYTFWEGEPWSPQVGIKNEILRRGHTISEYNLYHDDGEIIPNLGRRTYSIQGLIQLIQDVNNGLNPDIFLHMDYGVFDHVALDKKYFNNNMFWLLEAKDTPQHFRNTDPKAKKFDCVLTPDYPSANRWENGVWWTHYADVNIFHPNYDVKIKYDCVTTCGDRGQGLTNNLENILGTRFNNECHFWGEDHAKRLLSGKIVFQCSQFKEITSRIFEGMACGKMILTDRLPKETRIDDLFIENEDIVYYNNLDDAINKIDYYSSHDEEREKIASNGLNKVIKYHTAANRVDQIEEEYLKWKSLNRVNAFA